MTNAEGIIYKVLGALYTNLADTINETRIRSKEDPEQANLGQLEKDLRHYIADQEHLLALIQDPKSPGEVFATLVPIEKK